MAKIAIADDYVPDFGTPWPEYTYEQVMALPKDRQKELADTMTAVNKAMEVDPIHWGWTLHQWRYVMAAWKKYQIFLILGGNRCLAPEQEIYDPVKGVALPISEIKGDFHVWSMDRDGNRVIAEASAPYRKQRDALYEVRLSDGQTFKASGAHRVLTPDGWRSVSELNVGQDMRGHSRVTSVNYLRRDWVWDITVPRYGNYEVAGVIHHNSSKSTFVSRMMVWGALTIPEFKGRCWTVNDDASVNEQQRFIWEALPARYKAKTKKKRGQTASIEYTQKNGFTKNKLILPPLPGYQRGGEIIFQTYRSYANDPQVSEGWWAHMIWPDEECPAKLLNTFIYRVGDCKGKIFNSFTTIQGWSPLVADVLSRTKNLQVRHSDLVGKQLPYNQESLSRSRCLISYFWTQDNPWIPQADMIQDLSSRSMEEKLSRGHGIPTRSVGSKFPLFDEIVHVVKHEELPWIKNPDYKVTRYMALDPAGSKNWFMLWVAIDDADTIWIYREWPGLSYGSSETGDGWALPGADVRGKPGPAQKGHGYGIKDYVELIRDEEDGEAIYERYIDSRLGNAEKQAKEGATSIALELEDEGVTFISAPGLDIEHGLQLINNRLSYDVDKPLSSTNSPSMYVSEDCQNMIFALKNFTALGGKLEACKDPVDCFRYILESDIFHIETRRERPQHIGSY